MHALHGVLTRAGTFPVREQEVTGFLVETPVANLAAVPRLPMYQPVAIIDQAEWDAALAVLRDVGNLTDFMSKTYPEAAGMKSTVTAVAEITRLRAALKTILHGGYAEGADRAHPAIALARDTLDPKWRERAAAHYPKP